MRLSPNRSRKNPRFHNDQNEFAVASNCPNLTNQPSKRQRNRPRVPQGGGSE
jgi:hypothetical protein